MRFVQFLTVVVSATISTTSVAADTITPDTYPYCHATHFDTSTYPKPPSTDRLQNVQVITRHGARTPVNLLHYDDAIYDQCRDQTVSSLGPVTDTAAAFRLYQQQPLTQTPLNPFTAHQRSWSGNCAVGELTEKGVQQHRELGAALRRVYVEELQFVNGKYEEAQVYVRSTDVWRTKQSAQSLLTGLFGVVQSEADSKAGVPVPLPIPIHTYSPDYESMTSNPTQCPAWNAYYSNMTASTAFQLHMSENELFLQHLANATNMQNADPSWFASFDHFFDQTHVRFCHNMKLPCSSTTGDAATTAAAFSSPAITADVCVTDDDVQKLMELVEWEYKYTFQAYDQKAAARLGISAFLHELHQVQQIHHNRVTTDPHSRESVTRKKHHHSSLKQEDATFVLYSGHDTTIAPLVAALDVSPDDWTVPPYAANLIFELWERPASADASSSSSSSSVSMATSSDNKKRNGSDEEAGTKHAAQSTWYVRLFLNGKLIQLPWCAGSNGECDFSEFSERVVSLIPTNFLTECGLSWQ